MLMDITLVLTVALAAAFIVMVLVVIIIYQRWLISDQNVFIKHFIRQSEEQRQKMRKLGII